MAIDADKTIDLLETAYDNVGDIDAWRTKVLKASMRIVGATSGAWFDFAANTDHSGAFGLHSLTSRVLCGDHVRAPSAGGASWRELPADILHQLFGRSLAMTFRSLVGDRDPSDITAWRDVWHGPIVDNLGIIARDPQGLGTLVVSGVSAPLHTTARQRRLLDRVSYHFAAAARLRNGERVTPDTAEAVMSSDGNIAHATEVAKNKRHLLDDGRRRRDEAKKTKHDPEKALDVWKGLVAGRWSLVDHFDTDGKRFLLAMKNTPHVDRRADLSPRERRVCALVAMGHRDKEIAYMLGLSLASITAAIHRGRKKLEVSTRSEMARKWRSRDA